MFQIFPSFAPSVSKVRIFYVASKLFDQMFQPLIPCVTTFSRSSKTLSLSCCFGIIKNLKKNHCSDSIPSFVPDLLTNRYPQPSVQNLLRALLLPVNKVLSSKQHLKIFACGINEGFHSFSSNNHGNVLHIRGEQQ